MTHTKLSLYLVYRNIFLDLAACQIRHQKHGPTTLTSYPAVQFRAAYMYKTETRLRLEKKMGTLRLIKSNVSTVYYGLATTGKEKNGCFLPEFICVLTCVHTCVMTI